MSPRRPARAANRSNAGRAPRRAPLGTPAARVLSPQDATLLDLIDNVLNRGVVLTGEVTLGIATVDLIYLRLSALLCAADRLFPVDTAHRRYR